MPGACGAELTIVWGAQARGRKAEMTTKLEELQRDIERLDQISDEQVAAEEASVRKLAEVRL